MDTGLQQIIPNKMPEEPLKGWVLLYADGTRKIIHKENPSHLQSELIKDVRDFQRKLVWQLNYARDIREWAMGV